MRDRTNLRYLTCTTCDRGFYRAAQPGYPPKQCPDCRPLTAAPGVIAETGTKRCTRCREVKDVSGFNRERNRPDGRNVACKQCTAVKPVEVPCAKCATVFGWVDKGGHRNRRIVPLCPDCTVTEKHCPSCGHTKPLSEFAKQRDRANGRTAHCRACQAKRYAERDEATRQAFNLRRFNLTVADYNRMLAAQGRACAICRTVKEECPRGYLAVDHDHRCCDRDGSCGRCVRALLCTKCNIGIGMLQDNRVLLGRAIEYLTEHQTNAVLTMF